MMDLVQNLPFLLRSWSHLHGFPSLSAYRDRRLRLLVEHAYRNVPFYRELYDQHGVRPEEIQTVRDLRRLPLIDKKQLQRYGREILCDRRLKPEELIRRQSSGSTGTPFVLWRTPAEERRLNLLRWRILYLLGLRPGDRMTGIRSLWGPVPRRFEWLMNLAQRTGLVRKTDLDCFLPPEKMYDQLAAICPDVLCGYTASLAQLAGYIEAARLQPLGMRFVVSGAESIPEETRRRMKQQWRVPVYDIYACTEMNSVAWQCPSSELYHVSDDSVLLEIEKDGRPALPGEAGEIVLTSLHSYAMPFIRYQTEDLAVASDAVCPCGLGFSTLQSISGRQTDRLQLPDGRDIHSSELLNPLELIAEAWISQYQVVQRAPDHIQIHIVPLQPVSVEQQERLLQALSEVTGPEVRLEIQLVPTIPLAPSGKRRFVIRMGGETGS